MSEPADALLDALVERAAERAAEKTCARLVPLLSNASSGGMPGPWLRLKEAAEYVRMGYPKLTRRVANREIPYHVIPGQEDTGRNRRIHVEDLDEWMGRYKAREVSMLYGRRRKA